MKKKKIVVFFLNKVQYFVNTCKKIEVSNTSITFVTEDFLRLITVFFNNET